MMPKLIIAFVLGLLAVCPAQAGSGRLDSLDAYIKRAPHYDAQKRSLIRSLQREVARSRDDVSRFRAYSRMYDAYSSFQYDTAALYADRMLAIACRIGDRDYIVEAKTARTFTLLSAGLYKEAFDQLESIDLDNVGAKARCRFFFTKWKLLASIIDYVHAEPYRSSYLREAVTTADSLAHYLPADNPSLQYVEGMMCSLAHGDREAARRHFVKALADKNISLHQRAIILSSLGWAYRDEGDSLKALDCIAEAAICDIKSATKETTAIRVVGSMIYSRGDLNRAFGYVRKALDDANFYGARQRMIEIGNILPIIQQERYRSIARQRNIIIGASVLVLLLLIAVLASLYFIRRQMGLIRRQMANLQTARRTIEEHNAQLKSTNAKLVEANKIKDEYIGRSFYTNAEYICKVEKLYRTVDRKIQAGQYDDLRRSLKESTLVKERKTMYADFDETFLTIFPDFIGSYNMLFDEANRVVPEQKMTLTTEMRIFALIRIGISDSERIAQFLNYSVNTINTYKTRVKNKSLVSNDLFEQRIMEI